MAKPDAALTDRGLARRLAADLDAAFPLVVVSYQDRLYRFVLRFTGCAAEAEDVAQDAFVRAYRWLRTNRIEPDTFHLRPWLYRVALNVCRNRARRGGRTVELLDEPAGLGMTEEPERGPEGLAEANETRAELAALLAAMPANYRAAVVLRHVEELSYADVAAATGCPLGTAKSNVHRGLAWLRSHMHPLGGVPDGHGLSLPGNEEVSW